MTGSVAGAPSAAAMTTVAAVGVQRAAWLLLVLPLAGAVILLLGGKRTNAWGHLIGVAMPVASFVYGLIAFIAMPRRPYCRVRVNMSCHRPSIISGSWPTSSGFRSFSMQVAVEPPPGPASPMPTRSSMRPRPA